MRAPFILTLALAAYPANALAHAGEPSAIVVLGAPLADQADRDADAPITIKRARLDSLSSGQIDEALRDIAGLQQFRRSDSRSSNPTAQGLNARALGGNAASRTLVTIDGVPLTDPFFGSVPLSSLIPNSLSSIRVTRGGGPVEAGSGSVGGLIALMSATHAEASPVKASAFFSGHDALDMTFEAAPNLGNGFVQISARWNKGDGFWTTPGPQRTVASVPAAYDSKSVTVRAAIPLSPILEVQSRLSLSTDDRTLRFRGADSHIDGQDASIRMLARGRWEMEALAYVQARNFSNVVISATSFRKTLDQRNTPATGIGGKLEVHPPVGDGHPLHLGVDTRIVQASMFEDAYNAGRADNPVTERRSAQGRQTNAAMFAQYDLKAGPLSLGAGGRIDHWTIADARTESRTPAGVTTASLRYPNRSGTQTTGRVNAGWEAFAGLRFRAAAYTGFRLPTLNELYRTFTVFPVTTRANAALRPERLKGAEIGMEWSPAPAIHIGATLFDNRLNDAVSNVTVSADGRTRQRQNVQSIHSRGIEADAQAQFSAITLNLSYAHAASHVVAPGTALDGLRPAQSPRDSGSATASWAPSERFTASASLHYVGRQFEDDLNSDTLSPALTVDGHMRVGISRAFELIMRAENIFDRTVITRNAAGSIDVGAPRTIWFGISLRQ